PAPSPVARASQQGRGKGNNMLDSLQQFAIPNAVAITAGINGLPRVTLTHRSGSSAEVYLHGAHVTSWKTSQGDELFFVSRESYFAPERPIRGGIPVIFPQFGGGPLPQHGFARTSEWELARTDVQEDGTVSVVLQLTDSPETLAVWPYHFALELGVHLNERALTVTMQAENRDDRAFPFHAVLHTYFGLADIRRAAVRGLQGITLIDSLRDDLREVETCPAIRFAEETDRIYVDAPDRLWVDDEGNGRIITIEKHGMPDVVVWNPWIAKAQRMADFGDDEYLRMVCVETGIMAEQQALSGHATWRGETMFSF
ncbi:MAG: D-hexose-6-phosphate mutarotase, partial [Armatimonadota bacterium]